MTAAIPLDAALPRMPRLYVVLAGLAMATGSVVLIEPAPYDVALILLLAFGIPLGRLWLTIGHRLPIALLAMYLAVQTASLVRVPDLSRALGYLAIDAYMAVAWLFFTGIVSASGYRAISALMAGYTVAGLVAVIPSALAFLGWLPSPAMFLRYGRAQGLFKDPNVFGPYLVPVLLYAFARLQRARALGWTFFAALAVCGLTAAGLFLSFSRAAWINGSVAILVFFILRIAGDIRNRTFSPGLLAAVALLVSLAGGIVLLSLAGNSPAARMLTTRLGANGLQGYDEVRFYTHNLAIASVIEQPLGLGPGQAEIVFDYATHNMYLRVLSEAGVLGSVLLYGFVLLCFIRAIRGAVMLPNRIQRDLFAVVAACLFGIFINGLVIDTLHWRHFWFLLALAWWTPRSVTDPEAFQ